MIKYRVAISKNGIYAVSVMGFRVYTDGPPYGFRDLISEEGPLVPTDGFPGIPTEMRVSYIDSIAAYLEDIPGRFNPELDENGDVLGASEAGGGSHLFSKLCVIGGPESLCLSVLDAVSSMTGMIEIDQIEAMSAEDAEANMLSTMNMHKAINKRR